MKVSIARRRLVVLRPAMALSQELGLYSSFNRPKAISCLATLPLIRLPLIRLLFQSPEGD